MTFPAGAQTETLRAVLNGKDVTSRFSETGCPQGKDVCETGTLSEADGLRAGKNVLFATVKKENGSMASSRLRFAGSDRATGAFRAAVHSAAQRSAVGASNGITASFFIPPTVAVKTLTPGGWNGSTPWIAVGDEQLPAPAILLAQVAKSTLSSYSIARRSKKSRARRNAKQMLKVSVHTSRP